MNRFAGNCGICVLAMVIAGLAGCSGQGETGYVAPEEPAVSDANSGDIAVGENSRIDMLADEIWEDQLKDNMYARLQLGLPVVKLPDISLEGSQKRAEKAGEFLVRVKNISSEELSHDREITRRVLINMLEIAQSGPEDYAYSFAITPYRAGFGFILPRALAAIDLTTYEGRENYLSLLDEFADFIEQAKTKTEFQASRGIYLPKPALPGSIGLITAYRDNVSSLRPAADRLGDLSDQERRDFEADVSQVINSRVLVAYDSLLAYVGGEDYAANAPETVGLTQYPGGEEAYARAIKRETSYAYTPRELHDLGKRRMAELSDDMAAVRETLGFEGTQAEFHDFLRSDPRFIADTPAEVEQRYMSYVSRIEPLIDDFFSLKPAAPYGVKRLAPEQEPGQTFGYYSTPTAQEPRGLYRYNGSELENRSLVNAGSLIYHELLPGHHFHLALQMENESIPDIRRYGFSSAGFTEGWAEYSAGLGYEMGLYDDPYDHYGRLIMEVFLTSRLVVDTGLNALGWSLEEARQYMAANTFLSDIEIASEVLRYSTDMPGQALAYKTGHLSIDRFRAKAEAALGDDFDIKAFHAAMLGNGTIPINVLEWQTDWFIAQQSR